MLVYNLCASIYTCFKLLALLLAPPPSYSNVIQPSQHSVSALRAEFEHWQSRRLRAIAHNFLRSAETAASSLYDAGWEAHSKDAQANKCAPKRANECYWRAKAHEVRPVSV
jgi:hypothetical protein